MQSIVFPIIRFLHDLFTAVWIGGLILLPLVILPAIKKNPKIQEPKMVIRTIQNRLKVPAIISMVGLALTGLLLSRRTPGFSGLFDFSSQYTLLLSVKHILMMVMVLLALTRLTLNKKNEKQPGAVLEKASALVLVLNAISGVVVLFLSAYLSVGF